MEYILEFASKKIDKPFPTAIQRSLNSVVNNSFYVTGNLSCKPNSLNNYAWFIRINSIKDLHEISKYNNDFNLTLEQNKIIILDL